MVYGKNKILGLNSRGNKLVSSFVATLALKIKLNEYAVKNKITKTSVIREALESHLDGKDTLMSEWKNFVVTLCRLGSTNSSREISDAIQRTAGVTVSSRSIAAIRANFTMGRYA